VLFHNSSVACSYLDGLLTSGLLLTSSCAVEAIVFLDFWCSLCTAHPL